MPSRPRSQKLWTFGAQVGERPSGVVSVRLSNTLIRPLFSATKTRPSGEKLNCVGFVKPPNTTSSWNPLDGGGGPPAVTVNVAALLFQWWSVAQPGLNTPIRTMWIPSGSLAGTAQLNENDRCCPAAKLWLS